MRTRKKPEGEKKVGLPDDVAKGTPKAEQTAARRLRSPLDPRMAFFGDDPDESSSSEEEAPFKSPVPPLTRGPAKPGAFPEGKTMEEAAATEEKAPPPAGTSVLAARIDSATYLGEMRQFTCRLDSGDTWRVTVLAGGQAALGAGDAVRQSTSVCLRRIAPGRFELTSDVDVSLSLPARSIELVADGKPQEIAATPGPSGWLTLRLPPCHQPMELRIK